MDWMQQSVEMMKSWNDMQKKMWESWLDSASGLGKTEENPLGEWIARWRETSEKSLEAWQDLVRKMVESQGKWAGSESVAGVWPGKEQDVKKMAESWTEQTLAVMKSWTVAQKQLWDDWFAAATNMAKSAKAPNDDWYERWQDAARTSMDAWDKLTRKTLETQSEWFKGWMKASETTRATTDAKSTAKAASA
ncbi:MAG TPA: hypothetical protein VJ787_11395 [Thermoleophilia bacterium]|nr:hypothetical protein [Thermoleophilia bacterium]